MGDILAILRQAVQAVPQFRYVYGVVAVAASALLILQLSQERPVFALLSFVFGFGALLLVSSFVASNSRKPQGITLPIALITWVTALVLCTVMVISVTASAGWGPDGWCNVIGCKKQVPDKDKTVENQPPPSPVPEKDKVSQSFKINDSSNDCGIEETRTVLLCLPSDVRVTGYDPAVTLSAGGGSAVQSLVAKSDQLNCYVAMYLLKGEGYDNLPFGIKNCRGRGWLEADITVHGER